MSAHRSLCQCPVRYFHRSIRQSACAAFCQRLRRRPISRISLRMRYLMDRIAQLRGPDGREEECEAAYIAGCDGVHSIVRETMRTGYPGGTYRQLFYVADQDRRNTW